MVKQRIIEEASELFGLAGVKSTTMDDLARHLGISKRTIYENFQDKEDLLVSCIAAFSENNKKYFEKLLLEADNVVEAILAILQMSAEKAALRQISMVTDIKKYYPQVFKVHLTQIKENKYRNIIELLVRGIDEGVFRNDLNPEIIAYFFCQDEKSNTFNDSIMEKFSFSEIFENMVITFLRGVCTPKGIEIIDRHKKVNIH